MTDFLTSINWIDLLYVIIAVRVVYIAYNRGVLVEAFKFAGTLLALYISLHYFVVVSDAFQSGAVREDRKSLQFLDSLCYAGLAAAGYGVFAGLRFALDKYLKADGIAGISRWCGLVLGVIRAYLLIGILTFGMMCTGLEYFRGMVKGSISAMSTRDIAPNVYGGVWYGALSNIMTAEKYNRVVADILKRYKSQ